MCYLGERIEKDTTLMDIWNELKQEWEHNWEEEEREQRRLKMTKRQEQVFYFNAWTIEVTLLAGDSIQSTSQQNHHSRTTISAPFPSPSPEEQITWNWSHAIPPIQLFLAFCYFLIGRRHLIWQQITQFPLCYCSIIIPRTLHGTSKRHSPTQVTTKTQLLLTTFSNYYPIKTLSAAVAKVVTRQVNAIWKPLNKYGTFIYTWFWD